LLDFSAKNFFCCQQFHLLLHKFVSIIHENKCYVPPLVGMHVFNLITTLYKSASACMVMTLPDAYGLLGVFM
jgi:hypothetical protein